MPTAVATSLRGTVDGLQGWLANHPHIRIDYIEFADESEVVMTSFAAGGFTALITAADVADALTDASIEVTDLDNGVATLAVHGTMAENTANDLAVSVTTSVIDGARAVLLRSLAARPVDEPIIWTTTAAHLRAVVASIGGLR